MYLIQQITTAPLQQKSLILYNGNILSIVLNYLDSQQGWFINNLIYQDFVLNGTRITVNPNILNQFKNKLPFGLGCFTTLSREPTLQQDFSSNNFKLYILDQREVNTYNQLLSVGRANVSN